MPKSGLILTWGAMTMTVEHNLGSYILALKEKKEGADEESQPPIKPGLNYSPLKVEK